jgi:pimeloyl-ACP methyl ester carboxylesterase
MNRRVFMRNAAILAGSARLATPIWPRAGTERKKLKAGYATASDGARIYYEVLGNENGADVFLGPHFYATRPKMLDNYPGYEDPTQGFINGLEDGYRLIIADYPRGMGKTGGVIPGGFTPDQVAKDYEAIIDAAGAKQVAWIGYSYGGVVGVQLACRTNRLSALVCGGWPPLKGPYKDMLKVLDAQKKMPLPEGVTTDFIQQSVTFYEHLVDWPEQEEVTKISCPRLVFMGEHDKTASAPDQPSLSDILHDTEEELEKLGWIIKWIPSADHMAAVAPGVALPIIKNFLDSIFPG